MRRWIVCVLWVGLLGVGCKTGGAAAVIRPPDKSASEALGEGKCTDVAEGAEPLIVDWRPEDRGDLEVAMKDGIAVLKYSCEGIELLADCHLPGNYAFVGTTKREQVVRLQDADEMRANLPLSGATLGAEMQRGSVLDIALVMIGKQRSAWDRPTLADLEGECAGATHYVRAALVGAFAMASGSQAEVRASAEVFKVGASAGSTSSREVKNKDGDPSSCGQAKPDAEQPPAQCGAALRLVLRPIAAAPKEPGEAPPPPAAADDDVAMACPKGMVLANGKCTATTNAPHQCARMEEADCKAQCDAGHLGSCATLGGLLAATDAAAAKPVLAKACDGGEAAACVSLGKLETDAAQGKARFQTACDAGDGAGCLELGKASSADAAAARAAFERGCDAGSALACAEGAKAVRSEDAAAALALDGRACQGGLFASCVVVGDAHETGNGAPKNPIIASMYFRRACFAGDARGCFHLGRSVYPTNQDEAKRHFSLACMRQDKLACAVLVAAYGDTRPVMVDVQTQNDARQACLRGSARDCSITGLIDLTRKLPSGKLDLQRACTMGDKFACELGKNAK